MRTMAKHRFQRTRRMQVTRLLLGGILVLGWGVLPGRAGQQPAMRALQNAKAAAHAVGQKPASTTPVRPTQTPALHKAATASPSRPLKPSFSPKPSAPRRPSVPNAETVQAAGQDRTRATPVQSLHTAAPAKRPTESSPISLWGRGNGTRSSYLPLLRAAVGVVSRTWQNRRRAGFCRRGFGACS